LGQAGGFAAAMGYASRLERRGGAAGKGLVKRPCERCAGHTRPFGPPVKETTAAPND